MGPYSKLGLGPTLRPKHPIDAQKTEKQKHKVGTPVKQNGSSKPCFAEL